MNDKKATIFLKVTIAIFAAVLIILTFTIRYNVSNYQRNLESDIQEIVEQGAKDRIRYAQKMEKIVRYN